MWWNWARDRSSPRASPALLLHSALAILSGAVPIHAAAQVIGRPRYVVRALPLATEASAVLNDMALDSLGYLHLATAAGLLRFDGQRVSRQTLADLPLLQSNQVSSVAAPAAGIWIGTPEGRMLRVVNGRVRDTLAPFADDASALKLIRVLPGGDLMAVSRFRVARFREGTWTALEWAPSPHVPEVTAFLVTRRGTLFAGTNRGLRQYDGLAFRTILVPLPSSSDSSVHALAEDAAGDVWISTAEGLFVRTADGALTPVPRPPPMSGVVEAIVSDDEGVLWFGGAFGLVAARPRRSSGTPSLEPVFVLPFSPSDDAVRQLVSDGRGSVVAGTWGSGMHIVTRSPVRVIGVDDGLPMRFVHHVLGDGAGGLWIGTTCEGITRLTASGVQRFRRGDLGIQHGCVRSLSRDSLGTLWIGQTMMLSSVAADGGIRVVRVLDEVGIEAGPMLPDGAAGLWLGMRPFGLRHVDRDGVVTTPPEVARLPKVPVWALARDREGSLWVGQVGAITRLDASGARTFTAADGVPPGPVRVLLSEADGTLWVGSYGGGLARYRDGRFQRVTVREGLFDNSVSAIVPDQVGRLWLMGNSGVSALRRSRLDSVFAGLAGTLDGMTLGREVGVPEGNGGFPAGWSDGTMLYFASVDGVTVVDPRGLEALGAAPRAIFESLVTDEGERPVEEELVLSGSLAGTALRVTAPTVAGTGVRLRYRVAGARVGWVEVGGDRLVPLSDLGPGRHTIELAASGLTGAWSAQPTSLSLRVRARWWQAWQLRLLVLGLGVAGIVAVLRARVVVAEARTRELRAEIARRERAEAEAQQRLHELAHISRVAFAGELATSIAHELNQPLAAIVSNADAARRMLTVPGGAGSGEDVAEVLRDISTEGKRASGVIRTLREFLRRGTGDHVPVDVAEIVGEVLPVLRHVLERHKVTVVVHGVTALPPVPGDRIALQQVLMNLLVNAVEAMASVPEELRLIEIEGRQERDRVLVCVRDYGPGVSPALRQSIFEPFASTKLEGMGMGLAISRSIVESHEGELTVADAPGGGAVFCLSLPVAAGED
jgi:signal transduction histidine kinase/ligand-binding sensor domain-containing protein